MYPADAVRTLQQSRAASLSSLGTTTLLNGCAMTSMFALPIGGLQFATFGIVKRTLDKAASTIGATNLGTCVDFLSSAVAAAASCLISVPQEIIKQRMVCGMYPNFAAAVSTIARDEGLRGFYTGALPTIARNVPFVVITFTMFSQFRRQAGNPDELTTAQSLRFGVGAALIACVATQPIDVVKTRIMTQAAGTGGGALYKGSWDCVSHMVTTEGPGVFLKGMAPRMACMGPFWALQFAVNEQVSSWFAAANRRMV